MKRLSFLLFTLVLLVMAGGCSESSFLQKFFDKLESNVAKISGEAGKGLIGGALDTLRSPQSRRGIDSVLATVKLTTDSLITSITTTARDTLLGKGVTIDRLLDKITRNVPAIVTALRDTVTSAYTRKRLRLLIGEVLGKVDSLGTTLVHGALSELTSLQNQANIKMMISNILSDSLLRRTGGTLASSITDSALSPKTRAQIDSITNNLSKLVNGTTDKLKGDVKGIASWILWTLGGIIALLMILGTMLYLKRQRERNLLELLTMQIETTKDETSKKELKQRIAAQATQSGMNRYLDDILREQKIPLKN